MGYRTQGLFFLIQLSLTHKIPHSFLPLLPYLPFSVRISFEPNYYDFPCEDTEDFGAKKELIRSAPDATCRKPGPSSAPLRHWTNDALSIMQR